jgi:hypothetical protein
MNPMDQQERSSVVSPESRQPFEYTTRLEFLYRIVNDSQETIRFLDTKAAFCVTLLTAMMAAVFGPLARIHQTSKIHFILLGIFAAATLSTLAMCLRVIFPTIHLPGAFSSGGPVSPPFFLTHGKRRGFAKMLWNTSESPLNTSAEEYRDSVVAARDTDLVHSMCDEVIVVSVIRQVKYDRLRAAIMGLIVTVLLFFGQLFL